MNPRELPWTLRCAACLCLLGGLAGTALAEPLITRVGNRVAVRAEAAPIGVLLRELDALRPLEHLRLDPGLRSRRVSVHLEGIAVEDALIETLQASGLDYMIWGNELWVGDLSKAVPYRDVAEAASALASTEAPGPRGETEPPASPQGEMAQRSDALPASDGDVPLDESGFPILSAPDSPSALTLRRPPETNSEMWQAFSELPLGEQQRALAEHLGRPAPLGTSGPDPDAIGPAQASEPYVTPEFTMVGESVTYSDPNFVPYKNRPEVRARRLSTDVGTIP